MIWCAGVNLDFINILILYFLAIRMLKYGAIASIWVAMNNMNKADISIITGSFILVLIDVISAYAYWLLTMCLLE